MTRRGRRRFIRPLGQRPYRRVFTLATEGARTEPAYFQLFANRNDLHIEFVPTGRASSPDHVLHAMRQYLKGTTRRSGEEAWIIVDKDQWTDDQLGAAHDWSLEQPWHGLAVSAPMFEYWLLLHFEDGDDIAGARECRRRLRRHLPNYRKGALDTTKLAAGIGAAVERGRRRDAPPCADWPRHAGSTVYRLVARLLSA